MARKDEQNSAQFDTGFGAAGGTFGGSAGGAPKSQAAQGGEFSSGFGGGTNAVSQIFRDGGMSPDDKRRKVMMGLILGVAFTIVAASIYYFVFEQSDYASEVPTVATTPAPGASESTDKKKADAAAQTTDAAEGSVAETEEDEALEEDEVEGEEVVSAPSSSGSYRYNEVGGGPLVSASAGTAIEVSRMQDFSVMYMTGTTNAAGQLRIPNPPPGKVYWRAAGKAEVSEIAIAPPAKLNIGLQIGASISASETMQWKADGEVAHFRLEFAGEPSFGSLAHSFSTNKKELTLSGVNPGNYFVRVGGLNVASGRWEYTRGSSVEIK